MIQHPTDEAKKRAEALAAISKHDPYTNEWMEEIYKHLPTIRAALSEPEAVEGLDEAINNLKDASGDWCQLNALDMRDLKIVLTAAQLYAQGRTRSEQEGWKCVPIEPTEEMLNAATQHLGTDGAYPYMDEDAYKALLYAAPPVTAPIEKVDGLAEVLAARDGTSMDHDMDYFYDNLDKVIQAARLQLQRQED